MKYEDLISNNQELTFNFLGEDIVKKGLFTNYEFLLSDQCTHSLKIVTYNSVKKENKQNRKEIDGSLVKQFKESIDYLKFLEEIEEKKNTFKNIKKKEKKDYPIEIIKEAISNAIIHRDYSQAGNISINIFLDRMEIVSAGGLPGLSLEAIIAGLSQPRNPKLVKKFYDLKLINDCGSGISKILSSYENEDYEKKPRIETTNEFFKIILPNINFKKNIQNEEYSIIDNDTEKNIFLLESKINNLQNKENISIISSLSEKEKEILGVLENNNKSRREIQDILSLKQPRAHVLLKRLISKKLIKKVGAGKDIKYTKI